MSGMRTTYYVLYTYQQNVISRLNNTGKKIPCEIPVCVCVCMRHTYFKYKRKGSRKKMKKIKTFPINFGNKIIS